MMEAGQPGPNNLTVEQKRQISLKNREYCIKRQFMNHIYQCKRQIPFSQLGSTTQTKVFQTPRDQTKKNVIMERRQCLTELWHKFVKHQSHEKKVYAQQFWREFHSLLRNQLQDLRYAELLIRRKLQMAASPAEEERYRDVLRQNILLQQIRLNELAEVIVKYRDNKVEMSQSLQDSL